MKPAPGITIGIDAANLRRGGGITHLVELLRTATPKAHAIKKIVIWGGKSTLMMLEDQAWLEKRNPGALDGNLLRRTLWQRYALAKAARHEKCDVLFVPGGSYAGNFHPVVTMSRNMLPFEMRELRRYGWSLLTLKLLVLRFAQMRTYKKADGIIFLTEYARKVVFDVTGSISGQVCTIPHGLNPRFKGNPRPQQTITRFSDTRPFQIIYVSIIDQYKHQWQVIEAIAMLRKEGMPVVLKLVGPAYPPALKRLNAAIERHDPRKEWVNYLGAIPFDELHKQYADAHLGLFASSCENMPNILLETMASGLPVACSNQGPMPEILQDAGAYFHPEQPEDIARALRALINSPKLRAQLAKKSFKRAQQFSWQRCASQTFAFLNKVAA